MKVELKCPRLGDCRLHGRRHPSRAWGQCGLAQVEQRKKGAWVGRGGQTFRL